MRNKYQFKNQLSIKSLPDLESILKIEKESIMTASREVNKSYIEKKIKKKDLSFRTLHIPRYYLKKIQKSIYLKLLKKIHLPSCAHGGVPDKSIITNAKCHIGKDWVANIDIKKFFDNIHYPHILEAFKSLGCSENIAKILTRLTTYKRSLPQGAITSPYLSNLVLSNLDKRFVMLCKNNGLIYTRYFDDITISGSKRVIGEKMKKAYTEIIETEGYKINYKKSWKFSNKDEDQIVNGLLVNNGLRPNKEFMATLEKYVNELFEFGLIKINNDGFFKEKESVLGKIRFLQQFDTVKAKELISKFNLINWGF
mgnify:CR=1 FL=1